MALPSMFIYTNTLRSYSSVSAAVIFTYDYLLTFEREVGLVWRSQLSIVNVLFFIARYTPFVEGTMVFFRNHDSNLSENACRGLMLASQWMLNVGIGATEAILMVRTWALWNRDKWVAVVLGTVFLGATISCIAIFIIWQNTLILSTDLHKSLPGECFVVSENSVYAAEFVIVIFMETLVLVLTIIRMARDRLAKDCNANLGLSCVLYRDGVIFFVYTLRMRLLIDLSCSSLTMDLQTRIVLSIVNVTVVLTVKDTNRNDLVAYALFDVTYAYADDANYLRSRMQDVIHSVLATRVLFNLRDVQHRERSIGSISAVAARLPIATMAEYGGDRDVEESGGRDDLEYRVQNVTS